MGQDSPRGTPRGTAAKFGKARRSVADSFTAAVGQRRHGVAQEFTFRIRIGVIGFSLCNSIESC